MCYTLCFLVFLLAQSASRYLSVKGNQLYLYGCNEYRKLGTGAVNITKYPPGCGHPSVPESYYLKSPRTIDDTTIINDNMLYLGMCVLDQNTLIVVEDRVSHEKQFWVWGYVNAVAGKILPPGDKETLDLPVLVYTTQKNIRQLMCTDYNNVLLIDDDFEMFGWGVNMLGALGVGDKNPVLVPKLMMNNTLLAGASDVVTVVSVDKESILISGSNLEFQLGTKLSPDEESTDSVLYFEDFGLNRFVHETTAIKKLVITYYSIYVIFEDWRAWGWGEKDFMLLENPDEIHTVGPTDHYIPDPVFIDFFSANTALSRNEHTIEDVICRMLMCTIIAYSSVTGKKWLYTYGLRPDFFYDQDFQKVKDVLSRDATLTDWRFPNPIKVGEIDFDNENIITFSAGGAHTRILTDLGNVYATGYNNMRAFGRSYDIEQPPFLPLLVRIGHPIRIHNDSFGVNDVVVYLSQAEMTSFGYFTATEQNARRPDGKLMGDPDVCSGHGSCVDGACVCFGGYSGSLCENGFGCDEKLPEDIGVCRGRGICVSQNQCFCAKKWKGSSCQIPSCNGIFDDPSDPNRENVCNGNGVCVVADRCVCNGTTTGNIAYGRNCDEFISESGFILSYKKEVDIEYFVPKKLVKMMEMDTTFLCSRIVMNLTQTDVSICSFVSENNDAATTTTKSLIITKYDPSIFRSGSEVFLTTVSQTNTIVSVLLESSTTPFNVTIFVSVMCAIGVIVLLILVLVCVLVCMVVLIVVQRRRVKMFLMLDGIDLLVDEKVAEKRGSKKRISLKMKDDWFVVPYDEVKIVAKIGQGGSNTLVFRAIWKDIDIAYKVFMLVKTSEGVFNFREFEKEVAIMSSIVHINILRFYGVTIETKVGFLMELCEQGDLRHFLRIFKKKNKRPYPLKEKIRIFQEICSALSHLHNLGVIHRGETDISFKFFTDLV